MTDPSEQEQLSAAETARVRRRDRDASAVTRTGMRTGLAKQFKQVLDTQARRAKAVGPPGPDRRDGRVPATRATAAGPQSPGARGQRAAGDAHTSDP